MKNLRLFGFIGLAALAAACATAPKKATDTTPAKTASDNPTPVAQPGVDAEEASLRGKDFQSIEGLTAIHFDYDSAKLKDAQLDALKKNAGYLKDHPNLEVLVAGFCDERGTTEYNLALGQKRAKEVREYYIRLGVPGRSLATISYGKENPSCSEHTESCWAQNRRAETRVRLTVSDNQKPQ